MSRAVILNDCTFTEEEYSTCLNYISSERRNILGRFHQYKDQCRGLASSLLARCIINESLGIDNKDMVFEKTEHGKPFCSSAQKINYNLSHSGNCVAGIFDDKQVGIDVEIINDKDNDDIVKRFFSPKEIDGFKTCEDRRRKFYALWTIKEAYIKYLGLGMSKGFDTFNTYLENGNIRIRDYELKKDLDAYIECMNLQEYYLTVISETKPEFEIWTMEDLMSRVRKLTVIQP
ncbi:4'-phosphopantetheinyl transferase family protein [Anaerosporobacter sp.]